VATGVDKRNYMMLILQQCTAADFSGMSNNFSLILTKKRIKMITRNEKAKGLWWRLLATLPVLAILMIANTKVTAQEQKPEKVDIKVEMGWFEIYDDFGNPMNLTDTIFYNEDGSYVQFKTTEAPDPITGEMRNKITATCCNADGTPNEDIQFHISAMEKHGDTTMYHVDPFTLSTEKYQLKILTTEDNPAQVMEKNNDTVYQVVDEMPEFPGGTEALLKFVANNVKYPEKAIDEEISGRVFISFVIEKDGSISNVEVKRGIGGGCDEEAVRVIKSLPNWKPGIKDGKPVRVSYMMPINFKLNESAKKTSLANNLYMGKATGTKDGVAYTMTMNLEFESSTAGYFVMTLTSQKKNEETKVDFEDVGLPFTYTFDGKSSGSIQPTNPDGSQLGEKPMPPYGFLVNSDGTITVNFYDFKEDIVVGEIVFKKVVE